MARPEILYLLQILGFAISVGLLVFICSLLITLPTAGSNLDGNEEVEAFPTAQLDTHRLKHSRTLSHSL